MVGLAVAATLNHKLQHIIKYVGAAGILISGILTYFTVVWANSLLIRNIIGSSAGITAVSLLSILSGLLIFIFYHQEWKEVRTKIIVKNNKE